MIYKMICKDCQEVFEWHTNCKELCPSCAKKHRLATQIKFNHSDKGKALAEKRKERKRRLYKWHDPTKQRFCKICGVKISRRAEYCRSCYYQRRDEIFRSRYYGHIVSQGNYLFIYMPNHHRAQKKGYVLHHIYIWEQSTGKQLPEGWHIHHLNGIKKDNRPVNLVALPSKKHYLVLQAKAKRIQELEALLNNQHQLF